MLTPVNELIEKAVQLELNMAGLYRVFAEHLEEDRAFWKRMEEEEKNHAGILKTGFDFSRINRFPGKILPEQTGLLEKSISYVEKCMHDFTAKPGRQLAINMALELERSAGEAHFQNFMESTARDSLTAIFQKLNQADRDHAQRIQRYWEEEGQRIS